MSKNNQIYKRINLFGHQYSAAQFPNGLYATDDIDPENNKGIIVDDLR